MTLKKILYVLFVIGLIFIISFFYQREKQVIKYRVGEELLQYTFNYDDVTKMDNILSKQNYIYSGESYNYIVSVIILDNKKAKVKEYEINNLYPININIPQNKEFIISFPSNAWVNCTWDVDMKWNSKILEFTRKTYIKIPTPRKFSGRDGVNFNRENLYFKSFNAGNEKIVMKYSSKTDSSGHSYVSVLNIVVK